MPLVFYLVHNIEGYVFFWFYSKFVLSITSFGISLRHIYNSHGFSRIKRIYTDFKNESPPKSLFLLKMLNEQFCKSLHSKDLRMLLLEKITRIILFGGDSRIKI